MPTIREILQARNEIKVHADEQGTVTEDDLFRICYNKQVEERDNRVVAKKLKKREKEITYLSRQDKDAVIMLAAVTQSLQNLIDEWAVLGNRPPFIMGALRTAQTMCYKVIEWMIRKVPEKDYMRVLNDVAYFQIGIYEYIPKRREE